MGIDDNFHKSRVQINTLVTYSAYESYQTLGNFRFTILDTNGKDVTERNKYGADTILTVEHDRVFNTQYNMTFISTKGLTGSFLFTLPLPGGSDYPFPDIGWHEDPVVHAIAHTNAYDLANLQKELKQKVDALEAKIKDLERELDQIENRL